MIVLILNVLGNLLIGAVLFSVILFFFSLAALMGMFPHFLRSMRWILRGVLILSYRLYRMTLLQLRPLIHCYLGFDLMNGYARVIMCIALSLIPGIIFLILLAPPIDFVLLCLSFMHGLFVGLAWEDIENPGGIRLGVETQ